ncbi:2427_t:CDS:2 [Gigaspora margarita]|uniref:2427_t:CDS:1 n=1 Tax=Gigaspora margarita TaxID=4874 RepID=A0ABN7VN17_GIGMA|nr:2427_t:CDS:2 [Gigaspora margarita]
MQRYIVASRINIAPGAGQVARREEAFGLVISCLVGPVLNWYNTCIKAIGAGNGGNQIGGLNIAREFRNKARAEIGRIEASAATGADIIPNGTWDENWSITGGEPTDNAPVAPNAGGGFLTITIAPGEMGVEEFSTLIKKVSKLARMIPEQQEEQFICSLNPMNQYNIRIMAKFEDTQKNITRALAEAEKFTLFQRNALSSLPIFPTANPLYRH